MTRKNFIATLFAGVLGLFAVGCKSTTSEKCCKCPCACECCTDCSACNPCACHTGDKKCCDACTCAAACMGGACAVK